MEKVCFHGGGGQRSVKRLRNSHDDLRNKLRVDQDLEREERLTVSIEVKVEGLGVVWRSGLEKTLGFAHTAFQLFQLWLSALSCTNL